MRLRKGNVHGLPPLPDPKSSLVTMDLIADPIMGRMPDLTTGHTAYLTTGRHTVDPTMDRQVDRTTDLPIERGLVIRSSPDLMAYSAATGLLDAAPVAADHNPAPMSARCSRTSLPW